MIVVGHTKCGGAAACLAAAQAHGDGGAADGEHRIPHPVPSRPITDPINGWLLPLARLAASLALPASTGADEALATVVRENVKAQVRNVVRAPTIQKAWRHGSALEVHGWVFELESGALRDLDVSVGKETGVVV